MRIVFIILFFLIEAHAIFSQISLRLPLSDIVDIKSLENGKLIFKHKNELSYLFDGINISLIEPTNNSNSHKSADFSFSQNTLYNANNSEVCTIQDAIIGIATIDNKIIIASSSELWCYQDNIVKKLSPAFGKLPNTITDILGFEDGFYVFSGNKIFQFLWINSEVSFIGELQNIISYAIDHWNNLWISTTGGIFNYTKNQNLNPPIINAKSCLVNGKLQENLVFSNEDNLNVYALSTYLPDPTNVKMYYLNRSESWIAFSNNTSITANNLSIDNLQIKAFINDKIQSIPVTIPYSTKPLEKSNSLWYIIFGGVFLSILVALFSLWNYNNYQKITANKIKQLKSENQNLQNQQKLHELQLNPHFVFNALNSIKGLITIDDKKKARSSINLLARFLRKYLYHTIASVNTISDEVRLLSDYLELCLIGNEDKFEFHFEVPDALLEVEIPNMILQPFIENCLVHGFKNIDYKGEIDIRFTTNKGYLVCNISDNGIGMSKTKKHDTNHKSVAIDLINERLALINKSKNKQFVNYSDLNPGTTVAVKICKL